MPDLLDALRQAIASRELDELPVLVVDKHTAQWLRHGTFLPADLDFDPTQIPCILATTLDGVAIFGER